MPPEPIPTELYAVDLAAVLNGMDTAVVAVRTGDTSVLANSAARSLFALPDHRPIVIDDLACRVRIFHAHLRRRLGVDELPLIRALSGRAAEAETVVVPLAPKWSGEESFECDDVPPGRRLRLRARPIFDHERAVVGSVCTAQDITDLHTEHTVLARRATELIAIHEVTRAILEDADARQAVCEAARKVSHASHAGLFEPNGRGDLVCTTHAGAELRGTRLPETGPSIVADVFATCQPRVLQSGAGGIGVGQRTFEQLPPRIPRPLTTGVWIPVMNGAKCIAVLSLAFTDGVPVREHLPVLEILAGETAMAIERQDMIRRLRQEASSDGLTGAANRRVWEEELPRTLAEVSRGSARASVVMLDFDHFKDYNDTHGHPAGDTLLREVVVAWRRLLRADDLLCRYGGEEFVVLLPRRGSEEAVQIAEKLRAVVPGEQTCSAGVAVWDGKESPERLVERLDSALYAAKLAGRDRVCLAD
jgi:diguanylate cyclase (GGDEF)-like protein